MTLEDYVQSLVREEGSFQRALRTILEDELNISLNEFCRISKISQSTMYKILEEQREPNLKTVRNIYKALKLISPSNDNQFVAVIASSTFMNGLPRVLETVEAGTIEIKEYAVSSVEDAVIASVRAERDGAIAIICAPIVAETITKIARIPVHSVMPMNSVINILEDIRLRY